MFPRSKTGKEVLKQEKDVLKQKKYVPKQDDEEKSEKKSHFFNTFSFISVPRDVPGRDGTGCQNPVPSCGKILSLSRCPFVPRQRNRSSLIVQGQRDKLKILPRDRMGQDFLQAVPSRDVLGQNYFQFCTSYALFLYDFLF